jgi:ATP-dependent protease ClpP protease subunit
MLNKESRGYYMKYFKSLLVIIVVWLFTISAHAGVENYIFKTSTSTGNMYDIYLDTEIQSPPNYRYLLLLLQQVTDKDCVIFHIDTQGGDLFGGLTICHAIQTTRAHTIADIHRAFSGGAYIALSCNKVMLNDYSSMMIHSIATPGISGEVAGLSTMIKFFTNLNTEIVNGFFKGFLSKEEIQFILEGKELWLNSKSMKINFKRINKLL